MIDVFSALGNPIRAQLVLCLADKEKCVQEMITVCGLAQSAVSQHLEKLREAGIVTTQREGRHMYYRVTRPEAVEAARLLVRLANVK